MLQDFFSSGAFHNIPEVDENLSFLRIKATPIAPAHLFIKELQQQLKTISDRDHFELFIDIDGTHTKTSDSSEESLTILNNFLNENDGEDFEIELKVEKTLKNETLSVYFLDKLFEHFKRNKIIDTTTSISNKFFNKLFFEIFSDTKPFYSKTIVFYPSSLESIPPSIQDDERSTKLNLFHENSSFNYRDINLLPSDFCLIQRSDNKNINRCFDTICSVLSLMFISNKFEFIENGKVTYQITGYKTINCSKESVYSFQKSRATIQKIYDWIYHGGNGTDKLGLARNVLSLHLKNNGKISFDSEAWHAIKSNYQIYLKGNINTYLDVKNKISDIIVSSIEKTHDMANELLDSMKSNIIIILTFLLTVVVVNGLRANGFDKVFSLAYMAVILIIIVISSLWIYMIKKEILNRFSESSESIKESLSINYNKILLSDEIDDTINPITERNKKYLETQVKRYMLWWNRIIFSFFALYLFFYILFNPICEFK